MKQQSQQLGQEAVPKLLFKLAAPAMIGTFVMALYNIVDALFVARAVGTLGVAATAIAFPVQMIVMAIAATIGVGGASIISRNLGAGELDKANEVFGNVISLVLTISLIGALLGLSFLTPLLYLFGSSPTILPYAQDFLGIILFGTIFFAFAFAMNNLIRSEGNAKIAMLTMMISAGLNIILNPIFIFGFGMGIKGSALATVIAQATTTIYVIYYFKSGKSSLTFKVLNLRPNIAIIKEIITVGSSAFIQSASSSIMFIIINHTLLTYGGDVAIGVFGIINRVIMFTLMPMMGIVQGLLPLVGYNYGAKLHERVRESIWLAIKASTVIGALGFTALEVFPEQIISIFSDDPQAIEMGTTALRMMFALALIIGLPMVTGAVFQALGKAKEAVILSLSRQVLFLIPMVLILPFFFGLKGIWLSFPSADLLSLTLAVWFMKKHRPIFFKPAESIKVQTTKNVIGS